MPRKPNKGEDRDIYASFCIKYMIDHKEYPNNSEGRKQAAGHCYSIYDTWNKDKKQEDEKIKREYITMSFQLVQKKQVKESDGFELDNCVMLVTDTITGNRTYFPHEEVEKAVDYWDGLPINLNHELDDIRTIVGHLEDVRLEDNRLLCRPVFDEGTKEYDTAMGFIKSRFSAGDYPNVSVGLWASSTMETIDEEKDVKVLRSHEPDHLALVVKGSCNPDLGCGIGIVDNSSVTIHSEDYVDLGIEELKQKIEKEILMEKIKLEEKL